MKLRRFLFILPLALLGCAATTSAPPREPPSGEVAVIDLNATSLPEPTKESKPPEMALEGGLEEAELAGMLGQLNSASGQGAGLSSIFGKDDALGVDGDAKGNMWGASIDESFGVGGLGLKGGVDPGTIGLGSVGSLGLGAGTGTGQGFGAGAGVIGTTGATPPKVVGGAVAISGRLPPEVIQRIVRANFGRIRLCYENGLRKDPGLRGKVEVKFVINREGMVNTASLVSSNLPDSSMVECVVRAFTTLVFPKPDGGIVSVVYPFMFEPAVPAPVPPRPAPPPAAPKKQP
jgi:hypothetical protein